MKILASSVVATLVVSSVLQAATPRAEGPVSQFTLPSETRFIDITPTALVYGGLKEKEIAITVDDGPTPETTPEILKIFKDHGVKATFFLVGENVKAHPGMVKLILQDGHSVGNHTWNHPDMTKLSLADAKKQITDTREALNTISKEVGLPIQPFFRFPFGAGANSNSLKGVLQELGLANFYWSMSAHDSRTQDPNVALTTSIGMIDTYKKGIFLLHETHPAGLKMLPYFLEELHRRDYKTILYKAAPTTPTK